MSSKKSKKIKKEYKIKTPLHMLALYDKPKKPEHYNLKDNKFQEIYEKLQYNMSTINIVALYK